MRVAFHTDQLWFSAPGGIGTYVRELSSALAKLDEPEIVRFQVGDHPGSAPAVVVPGSVRALYPSWALLGRPALPGALASCEVLHATNHAAVPPAGDAQALVVTVHDLAFHAFPEAFSTSWRWQYRAGTRATARRATLVLVPSKATAADLEDRYDVEPERIRVTPLAPTLPQIGGDPAPVLERIGVARPYILCPATLEPRKNQVRLIRAYRQVAPDVPHALVLAGPDGFGAAEVEREIARPGPGRVVRPGYLQMDELDALYGSADAVAYVSLYEGFGLPVVEAMARGVPVLTSTTPALTETAGDTALLVEPQDVAAIAEGLARVLTDEALRAELATRGRARAAAFSWEATARATLDAYRGAVGIT